MIDELQATFHDHAARLVDDDLAARTAAVARRVRVTKRRRAVGAGVAAAVIVPLAVSAILGVNHFNRSDAPVGPTTSNTQTVPVRESFAGRTLIDSNEVKAGSRELVLTVDATRGSEWLIFCAGVGPEFTVHQTIDDKFEGEAPCQEVAQPEGAMSFRFTADEPAGQGRKLRLWITRTSDGAVAAPAKAVLAAAVYELPDRAARVAGSDVMPLEEQNGSLWALARYGESKVGARSYTARFPARDRKGMLELITSGTGPATASAVVDGIEVEPVPIPAGAFGDVLAAGIRHTVTLRIQGHVPRDAQLGVVWRTEVP